MTREETIEAIKVMQAWADGETVVWSIKRFSYDEEREWIDAKNPSWNWERFDYHIKPKPLEVWHWVSDETGELDLPRYGYLSKEECESHHSGRYSASGKAVRFVAQEN